MVDDRNFDYQAGRDEINDQRYDKEFDYKTEQDKLTNDRYDREQAKEDQESAKKEVWSYIELGVMPSADLISRAGMSETDVSLAIAAIKAEKAKKTSSRVSEVEDVDDDLDDDESALKRGMSDLGLGYVYSPQLLVELENAGAIYEKGGKLMWADGWNANNFQSKLSKTTTNIFDPKF
jgi:hypothetical protein